MKQKKILTRLLAFVMMLTMVLGMNAPAMADEAKYYEGVISWVFPSTISGEGDAEEINISGKLQNGIFEFGFTDINGNIVEWNGQSKYSPLVFNVQYMNINGEKVNTGAGCEFNSDFTIGIFHSRGFAADDTPFRFFAEFQLVEDPIEPEIHSISTPFSGTAKSDREEYTLSLAGYFEMELANGNHELTAAEIAEQTIAIVAYHNDNGVKRVMRENTIEEMTVTVSGGEVIEYVIRGRVQTSGGTLDRYTCTITP